MTPLELTQDHKSKILEMCKVLSPEQIFSIHWFELSWRILNKLCEVKQLSPIDVKNQVLLYGLVCFNQSTLLHPVDYLYAIFKEKE